MYFNPRTHRGVRQVKGGLNRCQAKFQSTHPSWGATGVSVLTLSKVSDFNPRTHRGVRHLNLVMSLAETRFQSTHPSWGATKSFHDAFIMLKISIHAPIVGCDRVMRDLVGRFIGISIHAPIVGCDIRNGI